MIKKNNAEKEIILNGQESMDKKPLIGVSILAVVLLVMGSLSNVVGYQSVKSTVNDSPLFQTRTQRATNQQQKIITSQYLGIGRGNPLQFPIRDDITKQLKNAINIISKMDDKVFSWFKELCLRRISQDKSLKDMNPNGIVTALYMLKTKPLSIINSFQNKNNQDLTSDGFHTICSWFPGCIPLTIMKAIFVGIIVVIGLLFYAFVPTYNAACWSHNYLCLSEE
jgi:hypothetical protein